jgi:tetratricopeptide (TPR) repeat protein
MDTLHSDVLKTSGPHIASQHGIAVINCGRYGLGVVLLALALTLVSPSAKADQTATELPGLFEQLLETSDADEVMALESQIWTLWLEPPTRSSGLLMSQVTQAMSAGELDIALKLCNQLVDGAPEYAEAWNKRATIHYLMGNNDASVADIRETLAREPRHFGAISGLGLIFLREKNLQAALDAFEQVLTISPGSPSARGSVERVRREMGREI